MQLHWGTDIEPDVRAVLEPLITRYSWLIPAWCRDVYVNVHYSRHDDAPASTGIRYEYRKANLDFYGTFFVESKQAQELHIIHELLHVSSSIYVDWAEGSFRQLAPEGTLRDKLIEDSRIYCESWTQDLARVIYDRCAGKKGK